MSTRSDPQVWSDVDQYIAGKLHTVEAPFEDALQRSEAANLPSIAVSPCLGKFLHLLARTTRATKILEVGTLGGYSAIWMAKALPTGGRLTTIEIDPHHATIAAQNFRLAEVNDRIDLRLGAALEVLPALDRENAGPFDLAFIDADKANGPAYFEWALKLSRPGAVIIVDNVVRNGAVADLSAADPSTQGARLLLDSLGKNPRISATALQTVGVKGYDGFVMAVVLP